jgi:hypothetical protein
MLVQSSLSPLVSTYFFLNPTPNPTPSATPKTTKHTTVTTKQQHHRLRFHTPHRLSTASHRDGPAFSRYLGGGCSVGIYSGGMPRRDDRGGTNMGFCGRASSSAMMGIEGTVLKELCEPLELLRAWPGEPLGVIFDWNGC